MKPKITFPLIALIGVLAWAVYAAMIAQWIQVGMGLGLAAGLLWADGQIVDPSPEKDEGGYPDWTL